MKCFTMTVGLSLRKSLPVRGAWVEIAIHHKRFRQVASRSPCGERGLKCEYLFRLCNALQSLPVRGAWVEIA